MWFLFQYIPDLTWSSLSSGLTVPWFMILHIFGSVKDYKIEMSTFSWHNWSLITFSLSSSSSFFSSFYHSVSWAGDFIWVNINIVLLLDLCIIKKDSSDHDGSLLSSSVSSWHIVALSCRCKNPAHIKMTVRESHSADLRSLMLCVGLCLSPAVPGCSLPSGLSSSNR